MPPAGSHERLGRPLVPLPNSAALDDDVLAVALALDVQLTEVDQFGLHDRIVALTGNVTRSAALALTADSASAAMSRTVGRARALIDRARETLIHQPRVYAVDQFLPGQVPPDVLAEEFDDAHVFMDR